MDRIVKADVTELKFIFTRDRKCSATFSLTNLMHTMPVVVSLSTSNPAFAFTNPFSLLPPLSTSSFTLHLARPSSSPPLSSPPDTITVRSAMLPTGKASPEDLRRLFSKPGSHIFKDAVIPVSLVGPHVVEYLFCPSEKTLDIPSLLPKALSGCHTSKLDSLLRAAAKSGCSYFVAALIDSGADPNFKINESDSVLSLAIQSGDYESVHALIESGYSIDSTDRLLHDAAELDLVDLLKVLCQTFEEIDLNLTDSLGRTALHIAAIKGSFKAVQYLISIGCDPDIRDSIGWTPLHYAASGGYTESAELLVQSSIYAKDIMSKDSVTPFSLAVEKGYTELYDLLHLGDVLHRAARVGDVREVRKCLADGAKVNSRDQNGWTPLHRAAFKGRIECVKVLLKNGALVDLVENDGRTAIQLALEAGHLQIVSCLKSHGAKASGKNMKDSEMKGKIVKSFDIGRLGLDCFKNHLSLVASIRNEKEIA